MRALVVDDSKAMRMILGKILGGVGFAIDEAGDGQAALDHLEGSEAPDVMLVDWNMPVMNGIEFVRAVRAQEKYADIPMMMVTTEDDMDHVVQALEAGANEYVMKPFTDESIREKLSLLGINIV